MRKTSDYVSMLDHDTVKNTCRVCPRTRKLEFEKNSDLGKIYSTSEKKMCNRCLVSLARRKLAYSYIMDYFNVTGKKYFTISNIKIYLEDSYDEDVKFVSQALPIIIRELIACGYIEIFLDRNNGRRYKLVDLEIESKAESNKSEILMKGFGFANGVKRVQA